MKIKNRLFSLYMKVNYIVATAMMMVVVSCTEQIDIETSADAGLQIKVVNDGMFDSEKGGTRATYSGLTTTFENGDSIGIYAVQGTTVKHANVKATLNNGTWFLHDFVKYKDNYTYYAYFPYQKTPSTPDFTQSTLDTKFGGMISGWSVADDQSTTAKFKANDLMLAQGSNTSDNVITFQMTHKMALAVLQAGEPCTMSYSYAPNVKFTGTYRFRNIMPLYNNSNGKNYYIMKPDVLTSIGGVVVKAGGGKYIEKTIGDINDTYTVTKPDWVTAVNETRNPGEPLNFCLTVTAPTGTSGLTLISNEIHDLSRDILSNATPVSNYDLSTHDIYGNDCARTTANCYMVHAPGTYKLPLVYGNAIKNGATNTSAFIPSNPTTNAYTRSSFVNHADNPITGPWLKDHAGATPASAELLWQDAQGLISQVGINGDYLTFTVPAATITAGNAVIAVKNSSGTVVWSWHIWVTDQNWDGNLSTLIGTYRNFEIAPVNLGYVASKPVRSTYKGNTGSVLINLNNKADIVFDVEQPDYVIDNYTTISGLSYKRFYEPYYQWGRKDPFIPGCYDAPAKPVDKTVYNISGTDITTSISPANTVVSSPATDGTAISNPTIMYTTAESPYHWNTNLYINSWDGGEDTKLSYSYPKWYSNRSKKTVKTVYDPCPPGFCVPTETLWTLVAAKIGESSNTANLGQGLNGKSFTPNAGNTVFIYGPGYRSGTGALCVGNSNTLPLSYTSTYRNIFVSSGKTLWYNCIYTMLSSYCTGNRAENETQNVRPVKED